jgi:hypothetical protein
MPANQLILFGSVLGGRRSPCARAVPSELADARAAYARLGPELRKSDTSPLVPQQVDERKKD